MSHIPRVLVMMATYNGEQHLAEQIDSILAQEGVSLTLRICDDRSTDNTFGILQDYAKANNDVVVSQNSSNVGVGMNFMQMVYESDDAVGGPFDYYAFSDQDDIWLPQKLTHAIGCLKDTPDSQVPMLYYSDMTNFDGAREWSDLARYRPVLKHIPTVLLRNWAAGCTMVFNRPLRDLLCAHPLSEFPRIHDVWVHLVGLVGGQVLPDFDNSYIRRRITGHNVAGELSDHHTSLAQASEDLGNLRKESLRKPSLVATQLLNEFGDKIPPELAPYVHMLVTYRTSPLKRLRSAIRFDFWQPTLRGRLTIRLCFILGRY